MEGLDAGNSVEPAAIGGAIASSQGCEPGMRGHPILLVVLMAVSLTCGCFGNHSAVETNDYLDDKVTSARVSAKLHRSGNGRFSGVEVATTNGVVYLTGAVATPRQKAQAGELARRIRRARGVKNGIQVRTESH